MEGILLLLVVLGILSFAFAWGRMRPAVSATMPGIFKFVLSNNPADLSPATEKIVEKAPDPAGNAEQGTGNTVTVPTKQAEEGDIIKTRGKRRAQIFTLVHQLMIGGLTAEQAARLVDGGKNAELKADIRAAAKILGTSDLAVVLGGRTEETRAWLNALIKNIPQLQEATEPDGIPVTQPAAASGALSSKPTLGVPQTPEGA